MKFSPYLDWGTYNQMLRDKLTEFNENIRILLKILLSLCGQNPIGGIGIWEPELTWVNFLRQKKSS